ncbi:MAG TPA: endonuclease/exonuclease/phosphatase family protein [Acidobacteriota bacterium]|nr:endonuclease/exonuclease/phosphatase family protein [Acidobacteriota bacterium]
MGRFNWITSTFAIVFLSCAPLLGQDGVRVRIMAANTSSGPHQSYPEDGPGEHIFKALKPDVVLIQEFNLEGSDSQSALRAWVDRVFGSEYHFCREAASGSSPIPNGVISRWPISECDEWDDPFMSNRDFVYARIDLPGNTDLWAVSVHLKAGGSGEERTRRSNEARALAEAIRDHPVPAGDYLVIGGDFNAQNRSEPFLQQLSSHVVIAAPFPQDADNDGDTNCNRNKPYDWVLADSDLDVLEVTVEAGGESFPDGFVFDPSRYSQSQHDTHFPPVQAFNCGGSNPEPFLQFQHMAVIRDFLLPADSPGGGQDRWSVSDPREIDFGLRDAGDGPFADGSLTLRLLGEDGDAGEVRLTAASVEGEHAGEFALQSPSTGPIGDGATLMVTWNPSSNDGEVRSAQLVLESDSQPAALRIDLRGETDDDSPPPGGQDLDLSGWTVEQSGTSAALTLPEGAKLSAGAILVIGRKASRQEFESYWGPLPSGVVYLNGHEVGGGDGFPLINGDERFRLLDEQGDPVGGFVPSGATPANHSFQLQSTDGTDFDRFSNPAGDATPGRYVGSRAGTGRLVITEFSDALGAGNWVFEFVELFYDGGQ